MSNQETETSVAQSTDDAGSCDRRGCERDPEYQMRTESPILHEDPTQWHLCDEHIHVAIREFRGSTNILTSRKITSPQRATSQTKLVTDGGQSVDDTDRTYDCPHCGGETFGLVVKDGEIAYARCRLCNEVILDG